MAIGLALKHSLSELFRFTGTPGPSLHQMFGMVNFDDKATGTAVLNDYLWHSVSSSQKQRAGFFGRYGGDQVH